VLASRSAPFSIGHITLDVHTLLVSGTLVAIGVQTVLFGLLARQFAHTRGLLPPTHRIQNFIKSFSLERFLIGSMLMIFMGIVGIYIATLHWGEIGFGNLNYEKTMRWVIPSTTLIVVGIQIVYFAFFSSLLNLGINDRKN